MSDQMLQDKYEELGRAHIGVMEEIASLKEQLKREQDVVDFYAREFHWLGITEKGGLREITKWIRIVECDMDKNNLGGRRAREVQGMRE